MALVDCDDATSLELNIQDRVVDVAIVADGAGLLERLPSCDPGLKVLVLGADGHAAELVELRRRPLAEPSPRSLVDVIHAALSSRE